MIEQREVIASEPFEDWGGVYMQLIQKSAFEWVVEVTSFGSTSVATKERLFLTKEFGPLLVRFKHDEWASDAMRLLEFAMKHIP